MKKRTVYPLNLRVNEFPAAACGVVRLRQVLEEHSVTELGLVPGYVVALHPGLRLIAVDYIEQGQMKFVDISDSSSVRC